MPNPPSSRYHGARTLTPPPTTTINTTTTTITYQQQPYLQLPPLTPSQRLATLLHSSLMAIQDPQRADCVGAVGEVTGSYALSCMYEGMKRNTVGRRILNDRPLVDSEMVHRAATSLSSVQSYDSTSLSTTSTMTGGEDAVATAAEKKKMTFGQAYTTFLHTHTFDPNDRTPVRYLPSNNNTTNNNTDLIYVMTRYRQCHDYFHVLTGLPPTVLGELGLKLLELIQTGLPLTALSVLSSSQVLVSTREREVLWGTYLPWAVHVGGTTMREHGLMCVYYEEEFDTELEELRERMGMVVAPMVEL